MSLVMRLEGLAALDEPTPYDGRYLKCLDFEDCELYEAHLETVETPEAALQFETYEAIRTMWMTQDPRDPRQRPLTAFSFSVEIV